MGPLVVAAIQVMAETETARSLRGLPLVACLALTSTGILHKEKERVWPACAFELKGPTEDTSGAGCYVETPKIPRGCHLDHKPCTATLRHAGNNESTASFEHGRRELVPKLSNTTRPGGGGGNKTTS